jgi:hypothetical protein
VLYSIGCNELTKPEEMEHINKLNNGEVGVGKFAIRKEICIYIHTHIYYIFMIYISEYGTATERSCLQRGPDDNEERCAYTKWNYKNVYMCFCNGDLCNAATMVGITPVLYFSALLSLLMQWGYNCL